MVKALICFQIWFPNQGIKESESKLTVFIKCHFKIIQRDCKSY